MIVNMLAFYEERYVLIMGPLSPPASHALHCLITTVVKDLKHLSAEELGDHFVVVAASD